METQTKVEAPNRRRFTVDEYHRMAEAGILREDDRVELLGGEIVEMSPIGGRHAACVREINHLLGRQLGDELRVDVQSPVRLSEEEEPQPDLAVIRARDYAGSLSIPEDVLLLIEVADTSLAYDRGVKLPILRPLQDTGGLARGPQRSDYRAPHRTIRRGLPSPPAGRTGRDARILRVARARHPGGRGARLIGPITTKRIC